MLHKHIFYTIWNAFICALILLVLPQVVTPVYAQSFTFGAAGDYANGTNFKATIAQVQANNLAFQLGLGDFAYSTVEQSWCSAWKSGGVNNILLISGNHDSGESSAGNINSYIQFCPYTLTSPLTGSYGKQYYFDYPTTNPIMRFILIAPGLGGSFIGLDTNYAANKPGYIFTQNAIDDARAKGIKWIVVGMHKNFISALEKSNEVGTDLIPMLINKKVDLILQGHEHGYERSKQLKCAKTGSYDSTCIANSGNNLVKGAGSVILVLGTGGQGLRGLNTGDTEYPYFAKADNTTNGFGKFTVSPTNISYSFVRSAGGNLTDSFTLTDTGSSTITPTNAVSITPTKSPGITNTPVSTPTPVPGSTRISLTVLFHGIGKGGDNANPSAAGNFTIMRPQRTINIELYNSLNQLVLTKQGLLSFNRTSGAFEGILDLGTLQSTGQYSLKIKTDQFLKTSVSGMVTITKGTLNVLPKIYLVTGDIDGDNRLSILDYNVLLGCYADLLPAINCTIIKKSASDLTDDGVVNSFDYNQFIRELTSRPGQ